MKIYNDFTRQKEEFRPIANDVVKIYVCGPTVYDSPHIGHARAAIAFDVLRRYLLYKGYKVTFVSNYTDIDDKMINRANELGIDIGELAEKYIAEYEEVMGALNVIPPDIKPRATETIDAIIDFIKKIMDNGFAYVSNGSVYFDVEKFNEKYDYDGFFGRKKKVGDGEEYTAVSDQDAGILSEKKSERDFALWKAAKPGEPSWNSPWGRGRPGWHIECSAMIYKYLGTLIDIHGGGKDLIFPHHTNETAQTMAAFGTRLANYWMHNGFVNINNTKMSKSLKNFFTVKEVLAEYGPMVLRMFLTSTTYGRPINFSEDNLQSAKKQLEKIIDFYNSLKTFPVRDENGIGTEEKKEYAEMNGKVDEFVRKFFNAMDNDLNTAEALSAVNAVIRYINTELFDRKILPTAELKDKILGFMLDFADIFGLIIDSSVQKKGSWGRKEIDAEILAAKEELIGKLLDIIVDVRGTLRKEKRYDLADKIRDRLKELGIELIDMKERTVWKYAGK